MTDRNVVRLVVWFTGASVLLFGAVTAVLAWRVLDLSRGSGTVDAAAVGVLAIPGGFTTTALGILGGLLISTRTTPDRREVEEALAPLVDQPIAEAAA